MTPDLAAAIDRLIYLIERQQASGLITRELLRAKDELRQIMSRLT
jgi:hypothetical protein